MEIMDPELEWVCNQGSIYTDVKMEDLRVKGIPNGVYVEDERQSCNPKGLATFRDRKNNRSDLKGWIRFIPEEGNERHEKREVAAFCSCFGHTDINYVSLDVSWAFTEVSRSPLQHSKGMACGTPSSLLPGHRILTDWTSTLAGSWPVWESTNFPKGYGWYRMLWISAGAFEIRKSILPT